MTHFLLVFDLDGTLIDTVPDLSNALNEVLREHGYAPFPPREVQSMVGDGLQALLARGFATRGADGADALRLCENGPGDARSGRAARPLRRAAAGPRTAWAYSMWRRSTPRPCNSAR